MKPLSEVSCLVVDKGLFLPTALKLAESFKQTFYWTPTEKAFPCLADAVIGDGFEKLIRIQDFWKVLPECELAVFPDVGYGGLQKKLVQDGHKVWGSQLGYLLETHRGSFLAMLESVGLEVPKHQIFRSFSQLRDYLQTATDKYIKFSRFRGDMETWHWRSWAEDEVVLDGYAARLGPAKEWLTFYVFDPIPTDLEDGVDTYCIDGNLPNLCVHAMEKKDKALLATVANFGDIPEIVRKPTEAFAPILAEFGYRQFFSSEVRIKGEQAYFIDPTLRCASPVSQLQTELFGNLAEIIWRGANGECIDPEPTAEFGIQLAVTMEREKGDWAVAKIPEELKPWLKCGFATEIDGRICIPPSEWMHDEFGWLVATGDSVTAVIDRAKELVELLPDGLSSDATMLAGLLDEVKSAEAQGIEFTDQPVPEPASVVT